MKATKKILSFIKFIIFNYVYRLVDRVFVLDGEKFSYVYHSRGCWATERCVEVPIGLSYLEGYKPCDVLEVGNVISGYQPVYHTVLDKYDEQMGVINEDVATFDTMKQFKLIFSISTLEHVGYDEWSGKSFNMPNKVLYSVENLKRLLTDGGLLVVTMPIGYRDNLDEKIFDNRFGFSSMFFLKRVSWSSRWVEVTDKEARTICFDSPFPKANGLFVGVYQK